MFPPLATNEDGRMNQAVAAMLAKYQLRNVDDHVNALREVLQEIALCGLWRGKFFERAAFYGGTALRILHGLDRFSEDMDFSLLRPESGFDLTSYCAAMEEELTAWGFLPRITVKRKNVESAIESAFLKLNTRQVLLSIKAGTEVAGAVHANRVISIRFEVDTDPPPDFQDETRFLLQPIPFSVRVYDPPSLFAGKMHAILGRGWKNRTKGRDWYDLVWYAARDIPLNLRHLETRLHQSGHLVPATSFDEGAFRNLLAEAIARLDVAQARADVERFLVNPDALRVWSKEFFLAVAEKIRVDKGP
jgi:hypothetical protein